MVLPLTDEDKPKCYMCHAGFKDLEELREHQLASHKDGLAGCEDRAVVGGGGEREARTPAPGDVTIF